MSNETAIVDYLTTDTELMATLTGGVYFYDDAGKLGFNADHFPDAFDTNNGDLLPLLVVKQRSFVPTNELTDEEAKVTSARTVIEFHFYTNGDGDPDALATAQERLYNLIQFVYVTGLPGQLMWINELKGLPTTPDEFDSAIHNRVDYAMPSVRIGS